MASTMDGIRRAVIELLLVVTAAGGCGEVPDPPWVLGEDPLVIGMRTEVTAEGPASGLFAVPLVPIDRTRAEPLPGDTVRIRPLVADRNGEVDLAALEPQWLLCPSGESACISTLDDPGAGRPCNGWPEERVACSLGTATELELTIPELDPDHNLGRQIGMQIAFVAGDPNLISTQQCMDKLSRERTGSLRGCLLAYAAVRIGPLAALVRLAQDQGIAIGVELDEEIPLETSTLQPNYNPEVTQLVLYGGGEEIIAKPNTVTPLPRGVLFGWETPGDGKDLQYYAELTNSGTVTPLSESLDSSLFFTEPDLRETFRQQFTTATDVDGFTIFVVLSDRRGGQGWGRFEFAIED